MRLSPFSGLTRSSFLSSRLRLYNYVQDKYILVCRIIYLMWFPKSNPTGSSTTRSYLQRIGLSNYKDLYLPNKYRISSWIGGNSFRNVYLGIAYNPYIPNVNNNLLRKHQYYL